MRPTLVLLLLVVGCGGARHDASTSGSSGSASAEEEMMMGAAGRGGSDPEARFGPLDVGADYLTYKRFTTEPFLSQAHGNRWVHVYVNAIGAGVYEGTDDIPVGTIVVKTSVLDDGGRPGTVVGPTYVMEKRAPGYFPDHGDWYFAIQWAHPVGKLASNGPLYWRGKSPTVEFCYESCHDNYVRGLGGLVPSSLLPR